VGFESIIPLKQGADLFGALGQQMCAWQLGFYFLSPDSSTRRGKSSLDTADLRETRRKLQVNILVLWFDKLSEWN
jgi:hypothetical protein